ncbi:hypothetical protein ABIA30_001117 [Mycobacterium sp. MAA66]|uniref:SRPBCC family protein n=1 Tax=Mycobacterium sp. MAA66 TaxID=3156297 RepID=UPI0035193E6B
MWIVQTRRRLTAEVPAPPALVRDFYTDLHNMTLVHPLVVSVDRVHRRSDAAGDFSDYLVRDRIPIGPLNLSVTYRASILVDPKGFVYTEARQFPQVKLSGAVTFDPSATGTTITENIDISAPRPLAAFTVGQAVKAHTAMLAAIGCHFE